MRIIWLTILALQACGGKTEADGSSQEPDARWEGQYAGECSDEADNDRDGLFDCDDEDCAGAPNCTEDASDVDVDSDGGDDLDADSDADGGADSGGETDDYEGDEAGECSDGVDNDRDGVFDCLDSGCIGTAECSGEDTGDTADADSSSSDGDVDDGSPSCDEEEAAEEAGEGEMLIKGWITLSGDVDLSASSCKITTWPWAAISGGVPDFTTGLGMLGEACIECPGILDTAVPFTVVLPVAEDGEQVGVIVKVEADGRIYEEGTDSNPLTSSSAGEGLGFDFSVEVAEPGLDDPGVDGGGGDLDPLDSGPDEPPDVDGR